MVVQEKDTSMQVRYDALKVNASLLHEKRLQGFNICLDSGYFESAERIIETGDLLEKVELLPNELYQYTHPITGNVETGKFAKANLKLPDFPEEVEVPQILILKGPEHKAMTLGRLRWEKEKGLVFQLGRFHTTLSQTDLVEATRQSLDIPDIQKIFTRLSDDSEQAYVIDISREGPLMPLKRLLEEKMGISLSSTSSTINHVFDQDLSEMGFENPNSITGVSGRASVIRSLNTEGMNPDKLTTLITIDPLASGMQHVALVEEVIKRVKENNKVGQSEGSHQVKELVIVAPMASLFGMSVVANRMAKEGIAVKFITFGTMLDSGPSKYYSPPYLDERGGIDMKMASLIRLAAGKLVSETSALFCSRCNWAASFFSKIEALISSEEELRDLNSSNADLIASSEAVSLEQIKEIGIRLKELIPLSTYYEADQAGELDRLLKIIEDDEKSR